MYTSNDALNMYIYMCNKQIEPVKYLEKCTLNQKVKTFVNNIFKKLSVNVEIDKLQDPLGGNFRISNGKVRFVAYLCKGLFKTKILLKVVSTCENY